MSSHAQISAAYHQLLSRGWSHEQAINELRSALASSGDYMMHDKDGNVIIDGRNLETGSDEIPETELQRLKRENDELIEQQRLRDIRRKQLEQDRERELETKLEMEESPEPKEPGQEYYEHFEEKRGNRPRWSTLSDEAKRAWERFGHRAVELELSEEGLRKKPPHDPDKAPAWTEVRGMTSFYYICPRCGAMVPGTGPQLEGPDGIQRLPKEHHENWHKSQLIDWFDDGD